MFSFLVMVTLFSYLTQSSAQKFYPFIYFSDLNDSSFPAEFAELNGIYYKGHDKDNHPIREYLALDYISVLCSDM